MSGRAGLLQYIIALVVILVASASPLLVALGAGQVASFNGCVLHEGFANPCVIAGIDFGGLLYGLGVMGWAILFTVPIGLLFLAAWGIAAAIALFRWYQSRA